MKKIGCLRASHLAALLVISLTAVAMMFSWTCTSSVAWGMTMTQTECKRCHVGNDNAVILAFHHGVRDANNWSCSQCHKPVSDGNGGFTIAMPDCTGCHSPGYHTEPAGINMERHHEIRNAFNYGCMHCHPVVQDETGSNTVVVSRDCFFCHIDGQKQWREVKWLTGLPTTTSPDTAGTVTDITSKFHDSIEYGGYEVVNTSNLVKALNVKLAKDASDTSKVTLGLYVIEPASPQATIRIYPYQLDGVTVDASTWKDFNVNALGWVQCDVTSLATRMSGFTWMKFRVSVTNGPLFLSEGAFDIIRSTPVVGTTNQIPIAAAGSDQVAYVNDAVSFSGLLSSDPDGTISTYVWNFGDGATGSGPLTTHAYTTAGTYLVSLTITDNQGAISEDFAFVTVKSYSLPPPPNVSPIANAGPDVTGTTGQTFNFSGSGSSDPDGTISSYNWNFGDGTSANGVTATRAYAAAGTYTVTLTVTDNAGATAIDTAIVKVVAPVVINKLPIANAGPDVTGTTRQTISFSCSGSSDPDGSIVSYAWKFGDGSTKSGCNVTKSYSSAAKYTVTLTVADNAGAKTADTAIATIVAKSRR